MKGARLIRENICVICFKFEIIMSKDIIKKNSDIGKNYQLLICNVCFKIVALTDQHQVV